MIAILFSMILQGCGEEQIFKPKREVEHKSHPRLSELNPYAWKSLPMKTVIADFQQSDGIFSSFICDEIDKRLSENLLDTLKDLNAIDMKSRRYTFKICFSPESEHPSLPLEKIRVYSREFPELINEISEAMQ